MNDPWCLKEWEG